MSLHDLLPVSYFSDRHFENEIAAAKARDAHARRIYGEFASLNFSEVAC